MLSRFFIDRPIFATVLSVAITLIGAAALANLPVAQYPRITPPGVVVAITYPGASARVVADTVAAPVEQQVTGVPGMLYMSSLSGNDGSYTLTCTFDVGTNLDAALVMVQNRIALAMPLLPTPVQQQGITIRKRTPDILLMVNFTSPGGRYDDVYLSNFVLVNVRDALLRTEGVSDVNVMGQRDYSIRVWLDPQKIAGRNMTAGDVANAIRQQNVEAALGQIGQPPMRSSQGSQLPVDTFGRLHEPEQFGDIVVKVRSRRPAPASSPGSSGGGLPRSGVSDPLLAALSRNNLATMNRNASSSSAPTTSTPTTPAPVTPDMLAPATGLPGTRGGAGLTLPTGPATTAPQTTGAATTDAATSGSAATATMPALTPSSLTAGGASVTDDNGTLSANTADAGPGAPTTAIVRLRDVARVELGALNYDRAVYFDGKPSVALMVYQFPETNALEVADRVRARMKELSTRFPEDVEWTIGYDTTPFISESIDEVYKTLRDAVILVAVVVLFFLQDWKAMVLPMIDVPVSLIGTFAVMSLLGYSLNNISLFGLVLAIGIVVDDAIVVLENIERQMAKGLEPREATIKAMDEITGPVLAITLVLTAVFIPCCFMGGVSGQFFRQFAVTIAASTIISAINALTMTPSRAVMIFKSDKPGHAHQREALPWWIFGVLGGLLTATLGTDLLPALPGLPVVPHGEEGTALQRWLPWSVSFVPGLLAGGILGWVVIRPVNAVLGALFRGFNGVFDWITGLYGRSVSTVLRLSVMTLVIYGGLLVFTAWQFIRAPTGFIPQQDKGYLILNIQLPDGASVERTQRILDRIEGVALDTPGVKHTVGVAGRSLILNANAPNLASMYVILEDFEKRDAAGLSADAIAAQLRERCGKEVRGGIVTAFGGPPIEGLGTTGGFKLIVEDRGNLGAGELQRVTEQVVARGNRTRGLRGLYSGSRASTPWLYLEIDRTKCAALGIPVSEVFTTLQVYLGSYYVNNFNNFGRTWQVNLQADQSFRARAADVRQLQVKTSQGQMVRLGTLVEVRDTSGPVILLRYNLYSATAITGNPEPGTSSGQAIALVQQAAEQEMPRSMAYEWTELTYLQLQAGYTAIIAFTLSVVFVFLVLAALYESWSLPLAVILVVPMCLLCSVGGVELAGGEVTIFTQIGLVVLVGLASKNAILIVEFAKQQHEEGVPRWEATLEACKLRLRPIVMTSFAFILGVVPLVIAQGAGSEMRRSLGTAVFWGMLGVTIFGIFLTPVFFYVLGWFGVGNAPRPAHAAPSEGTASTGGTVVSTYVH